MGRGNKWAREQGNSQGLTHSNNFQTIFQLLFGAAFGAVISFIITAVLNYDLYMILMVFIPLTVAAYLVFSAHLFTTSTKDLKECANRLELIAGSMDKNTLIVLDQSSTVEIQDKMAQYRVEYELKNDTTHVYENFKVGMFSSGCFGGLNSFEFWRNGKKIEDLDEDALRYSEFERSRIEGPPINSDADHECSMYIPLNLKPGETCTLEIIQKKCNAFDSAFKGLPDYTSNAIHYPTRQLTISVCVPREFRNRFKVKSVKHLGETTFEVLDHSENRMTDYESELSSGGGPEMEKEALKWTIYDPMLDCTYTLYFSIEEK